MDDIVGLLDGVQALPLRYLDYAAAEWCMRAVLVCVVFCNFLNVGNPVHRCLLGCSLALTCIASQELFYDLLVRWWVGRIIVSIYLLLVV